MKKKFIYLSMIFVFFILPSLVFGFVSMEPTPSIDDRLGNMGETILGVIQWSGFAIATGMIIYIGIKYTMAAANEKAELKQSLINYIIGAIVIICAVTIATWCYQIFKGDVGGGGGTPPPANNRPSNIWGVSIGSGSASGGVSSGGSQSRQQNQNNIWNVGTGDDDTGSNDDGNGETPVNNGNNTEQSNGGSNGGMAVGDTSQEKADKEEDKNNDEGYGNVIEAVGGLIMGEDTPSNNEENTGNYISGASGR